MSAYRKLLIVGLLLWGSLLIGERSASAQQPVIHYVYDDFGRLVAVVDPDGNSATYTYDAVGNLLAIQRVNANDIPGPVAITLVSPNKGTIGTPVSIFGKGFSPTPGENTVSFSGAVATVTAAATPTAIATQTVEYKDAGVILTVTPRIGEKGTVALDVKQEVNDVGTQEPPTFSRRFIKRQAETSVVLADNQTLALGGLIKNKRTFTRAGIPFLNRIPILGALFGSTGDKVEKTELLILITPRVLGTALDAAKLTEEMKRITPNIEESIKKAPRPPSPPPKPPATVPQSAPAPSRLETTLAPPSAPPPVAFAPTPPPAASGPERVPDPAPAPALSPSTTQAAPALPLTPTALAPVEEPRFQSAAMSAAADSDSDATGPAAPAPTKTATDDSRAVPPSARNGYLVQVGAFQDEARAARLAAQLARANYPLQRATVTRQGGTLHLVRVGVYPDRSRAEAVRKELEAKGFKGFIVQAATR